MKTLIYLVIATLFSVRGTHLVAQETKESKTENVAKVVSIEVPTIKCGSCVRTVSEALKKLDGVKEVKVDKKSKTAMVQYDDAKLKIEDMERAIAKAGYDANGVKRDTKAYEALDDCCK